MTRATSLLVCLLFSSPTFSQLPDPLLTPGVVRTDLSLQQICTTKWGKDARRVTKEMKIKVFLAYGYPDGNKDARCPCEIDHLVSRELGGADVLENLWPQSYRGAWNARDKDKLENRLHKEVCAGRMSLHSAQGQIAEDWTKLFKKFFGEPI